MRNFISCMIAVVSALSVNAQQFNYTAATAWSEKPSVHTVSASFKSSSAVTVLDERVIEYKIEKNDLPIYTSVHKIVHVNDDKGIEMYNKIYIPISAGSEITDIKARVILASGKVIDLPTSKIKEIEEDGRLYKLFAMEGLEKNAEVEYAYKVKNKFRVFGTEVFQSSYAPSEKIRFTLITPQHLKFEAKGYNGFKVSTDSVIGDFRYIAGYDEAVKDLDDEKYAEKTKYLKRVEYKLSYNLSTNPNLRLYTWKEMAKIVYNNYSTRSNKEENALKNFIAKMNIPAEANEEDKIALIENYIKTNINVDKDLISASADEIEKIVANKAANIFGIIKLFFGVFEKAGVRSNVVFPSDRSSFPIDNDFENWDRADDVLFHFPSTGKYIDPSRIDLRYPYVRSNLAGTKGLYLKAVSLGEVKSAIATFGDVPLEPFEANAHNMTAEINFNSALDTLYINSKQILTGYGAASYRPIYNFLEKKDQDEATKDIIKSVAKSTDFTNLKIENAALTDMRQNKPLVIGATIKSTELLEKAGNKILFKVGEIIGPQVEMYQEKPRQLPVEIDYPHVLDRKIKINIPKGYIIKNLADLNMRIVHTEGDLVTMGFVSTYKLEGNVLSIDIVETYRNQNYPLTQFEEFKKVINAAADFNKVTLVLEKQ